MLNQGSRASDPSWAAVLNPGQRPCSSAHSSAVRVSKGCTGKLTWWFPSRVMARFSGLLGCLLLHFLEIRCLGQQCVIWGNVMDDFSLDNMTSDSTHEYWSSLSSLCYFAVIYRIILGGIRRGRDVWHVWWAIGLLLAQLSVGFMLHYRDADQYNPISRCVSCTMRLWINFTLQLLALVLASLPPTNDAFPSWFNLFKYILHSWGS